MANFTIEQINSRLTTDAKNVIEQAANLLGLSGVKIEKYPYQYGRKRTVDG